MHISKKCSFYILFILLNSSITQAQYTDTLQQTPGNHFWKSEIIKKNTVPVILLGITSLSWKYREDIRQVRNRFLPTFKHHYDDYLQYAPAATVFVLNAFNIKGKHSPKRAFVSYAFSLGIMGVLVNGIKHTAKIERPDASSNNSFPSGHTAMAFVNATVLHKEYGQHKHLLYSAGGYSMATATAIGRGLNNKHWISDILAGAAIGIASTELGYLITDQIFKNRGMNAPLKNNPVPISNKPSFIEMHLGYSITTSKYLIPEAKDVNPRRGFNLGIEGAWFLNKNFGIGGEYAFTSFPVNLEKLTLDRKIQRIGTGAYTQAIGVRYMNIGSYFSLPMPNNWFVTAKLNFGISSGSSGNVILNLNDAYKTSLGTSELPYLKYNSKPSPNFSVGLGLQRRVGRNTAIKAYGSYLNSSHNLDITELQNIDNDGNFVYSNLHTDKTNFEFAHASLGLALTTFIW